jgi:hypothetical protein
VKKIPVDEGKLNIVVSVQQGHTCITGRRISDLWASTYFAIIDVNVHGII